ncbi:MAG: F0F1 ATP synthase subunit gamma, partial [Alphaproteobacteria bacterium]|nr:F0F1 ATP synthase subunit gamma [Alphaproteobacteria bacterium]
MPSLKALRNRISSVTSIRKITKAMQMVAAARLRRAQAAAEAARPYAEKMSAVISSLASGTEAGSGPPLLAGTGRDDVHLLIVATADRGLCGAFNSNIVRLARQRIQALQREGKQVKLLTVGRKGRDQLRRQYESLIVDSIDLAGVKQVGFADAAAIGRKVLAMFARGEFDIATIVYSRFRNVMTQVPTAQRLIPAAVDEAPVQAGFLEYEPDENDILASLLPRNVSVQIFRALLENAAGEMGAKMSAMDSATRNAG